MSTSSQSGEKFQIRRQGRRLGPFQRAQIDRMIARQQLGPKDEISPVGQNQWQRIDQWQLDQQVPDDSEISIGTGTSKEPNHSGIDGNGIDGNTAFAPNPTGVSATPSGEWYVSVDGDRQGPIDEHTLGRWISERRIHAETLVWRGGMQDWKPAREVLPAALMTSTSGDAASNLSGLSATNNSAANHSVTSDAGYAIRDLRSRRAFWVLTVCVITYIFAAESFAAGVFQIYLAVATRRIESSGLVALWAVSSLIFAVLLLMTAIELTKLISHKNRRGELEDPVAIARHEHRVWLFGGLSAAFVIANQIVLAIFYLITIAQDT